MPVPPRLAEALADRYRIGGQLGQGGMASVYQAEDLRHDREVALKVIRSEIAALVGIERFLQEIRTTARLQHPHILALFDSGSVTLDGGAPALFYVMPLVSGGSLRERLTRQGQLGLDEAIRITTQVAAALDFAHRNGVVHRDIKPENILLHDGQAVVADFGVALAVSGAGDSRLTETGLSVGTPAYMSPEQAAGDRQIDGKSDIYSLATVLYEMLAGAPPFTGHSLQAITARKLSDSAPSLVTVRDTVTPELDAVIHRALARVPADRYATAAEFSAAVMAPPRVTAAQPAVAGTSRSLRAGGAALLVALSGLAGLWAGRSASTGAPSVYDVELPDSAPLTFNGGSPWGEGWTALDVSPAGDFAVYVAQRGDSTELWYRSLMDTAARPIGGTRGAYYPMLSPDGREVAFFSGNRLLTVPIGGGTARPLLEVDRPWGGQWTSPDTILVADTNGYTLRWVDPATRGSGHVASGCPQPSHDRGRGRTACTTRATLAVAVLEPGDSAAAILRRASVGPGPSPAVVYGSSARLVDGEYLVSLDVDANLQAIRLGTNRVAGRPTAVARGVRREGFNGAGQFALSRTGTLVFVPGENGEVGRLVRSRPGLVPEPLPIPPAAIQRFDLSPDGRRLAVVLRGLAENELWIHDLSSGQAERGLRGYHIGDVRWSPDSRQLLYRMQVDPDSATRVWFAEPGGTAAPTPVASRSGHTSAGSWLAPGLVLSAVPGFLTRLDLRHQPPTVDTLRPWSENADLYAVDPRGRVLSYMAGDPGRWDVYVEPFPSGSRSRVTPDGGVEPLWAAPDRLIYRSGQAWFEVSLGGGSIPGRPRFLFRDPRFVDTPGRSNLLASDGSIIYLQGSGRTTANYLRVVPGWVAGMKKAVGR